METTSIQEEPVTCEFAAFSQEEREAHLALSQRIFADCRGLTETDEGISLIFENSIGEDDIREWIAHESKCCRFASFDLKSEADTRVLRVRSGEQGRKFLREAYRSVLGVEIKSLEIKTAG